MKSYWYVTKSKLKPKNRGLVSILLRKGYTIVELSVEADFSMIDRYGLHSVGCGEFNSREIQMNLLREIKKVR